jgi:hypothetical protein
MREVLRREPWASVCDAGNLLSVVTAGLEIETIKQFPFRIAGVHIVLVH